MIRTTWPGTAEDDAINAAYKAGRREGMEEAVAILRARHKGMEHLREYAEAQHAADEIEAYIRARMEDDNAG